ncbi:hypothetical protein [Streptomyces sp. GS7]|uniref:hypothetical protein n=1 Tax=Streptomyces sp. GS7 TaxID=2692234 RepID=UPI001914E329|nr:hypothetical protein [Streptomyces sp. GS7]
MDSQPRIESPEDFLQALIADRARGHRLLDGGDGRSRQRPASCLLRERGDGTRSAAARTRPGSGNR